MNNGVRWERNLRCEECFNESKKLLIQNNVLMPFVHNLDVVVTCDSSKYGVGAVMAHVLLDGTESERGLLPTFQGNCQNLKPSMHKYNEKLLQ